MMRKVLKYLIVSRNTFKLGLVYRFSMLMQIFTGILMVLLLKILWTAIYAGRADINGYTISSILTYFVMSRSIMAFTENRIDREVGRSILSGVFLNELISPMDLQLYFGFKSFGECTRKFIFDGVPLFIISCFFINIIIPRDIYTYLYFFISLIFAFFINVNINFIVGIVACWVKGVEGLMHIKDFIIMLFSGLLIPINFYPQVVLNILDYLPFKFITYIPIQIYLQAYKPSEIMLFFVQQIFWIVVFYCIGFIVMKTGLKKLVIYGG